jgi:hypothetical protein
MNGNEKILRQEDREYFEVVAEQFPLHKPSLH